MVKRENNSNSSKLKLVLRHMIIIILTAISSAKFCPPFMSFLIFIVLSDSSDYNILRFLDFKAKKKGEKDENFSGYSRTKRD